MTVHNFPTGSSKAHFRQMAKKYVRKARERDFFLNHASAVRRPDRQSYFSLPEHQLRTIAEYGPGASHQLLGDVPLSGLAITNELLLYRILKDLFGPPDYVTCYLRRTARNRPSFAPHPHEWGYMFCAPYDAFVEVQRRTLSSVPRLKVWVPRAGIGDRSHREEVTVFFKGFIADLNLHIVRNKRLFNEREEYEKATYKGVANVFGEMLFAGKRLLTLGRTQDKKPPHRALRFGESVDIAPTGTFYWLFTESSG